MSIRFILQPMIRWGLETDVTLDSKGRHKMRSGADAHLYNPATIHLLQQSTKRGDYGDVQTVYESGR